MFVLTFVLSIGLLVKATRLVIKGLPAELIFKFIFVSLPESLAFTVPLASLVSALLLFGRLSADGEVSAMRSCGVNIWRIMTPLIFFGFILTGLSIYINSEIAPRGSDMRHMISGDHKGMQSLVKILEPDKYIEAEGVTLWFESREGDEFRNLRIYERMKSGGQRETKCERALMQASDTEVLFHMYEVRISPMVEGQPGIGTADHLIHKIKLSPKTGRQRKKPGDYTSAELRERIAKLKKAEAEGKPDDGLEEFEISRAYNKYASKKKIPPELISREDRQQIKTELVPQVRSEFLTEYNRRLTLGMAPIIFILLGMPLGIRSSRRESNIGIVISLCIMLLYYGLMIAAKSLGKYPALMPHVVIWLPTVVTMVVACVLIRKNQ